MSIQALREQLSHENRSAKALLEANGDRKWSAEDQAKFDGYADEIQRARNQVAAAEKMRDLDAEKFFENNSDQGLALSWSSCY